MNRTIDRAASLISERLVEVDRERDELEAALKALKDDRRRSTGRTQRRPARRKRARRGQRQAEFLEAIRAHPETPVATIAKEMGVRPQQLYPIARRLSDQGLIAKRNGGYATAGAAAPNAGS